jgi:hypothetical protein
MQLLVELVQLTASAVELNEFEAAMAIAAIRDATTKRRIIVTSTILHQVQSGPNLPQSAGHPSDDLCISARRALQYSR